MLHLTLEQTSTLNALMDRIIPEDDYPSASEADVAEYISRLFSTDLAASAAAYSSGLTSLDQEAKADLGTSFADADKEHQDALITRLLAGAPQTTWNIDAAQFLRSMINIVSEGYYADPGNGGNRDCVSWQMVGFEVIEGVRLPVERAI